MKYRLIKEYPGSPELGAIWLADEELDLHTNIMDQPEYWEEIKEKKKNIRKAKEILEIQSTTGAVRLLVIPTDEELEIAEQTVEKIKSIQKK